MATVTVEVVSDRCWVVSWQVICQRLVNRNGRLKFNTLSPAVAGLAGNEVASLRSDVLKRRVSITKRAVAFWTAMKTPKKAVKSYIVSRTVPVIVEYWSINSIYRFWQRKVLSLSHSFGLKFWTPWIHDNELWLHRSP